MRVSFVGHARPRKTITSPEREQCVCGCSRAGAAAFCGVVSGSDACKRGCCNGIQASEPGHWSMTDATRGLAHGLTNYGDPDFALYLRRSFARSMGYSREMLDRPVVGIAIHAVRLQQLPSRRSRAGRGGEARRAGGRRAAARVPDHLAGRGLPQPDQPDVPQPDGDGHRGDDPRPADGRGRADRRLRQDRAGAVDGRGFGRPAGDPARRRAR